MCNGPVFPCMPAWCNTRAFLLCFPLNELDVSACRDASFVGELVQALGLEEPSCGGLNSMHWVSEITGRTTACNAIAGWLFACGIWACDEWQSHGELQRRRIVADYGMC